MQYMSTCGVTFHYAMLCKLSYVVLPHCTAVSSSNKFKCVWLLLVDSISEHASGYKGWQVKV
jgi:hypothetical protein